jgi:hypothetical protein
MGTAFMIIWGIALLAIAALLAVLAWTLKRASQQAASIEKDAGEFEPTKEIMLFEYEKEDVRNTTDGNVIVRIRSISWDTEWQEDLLRLEVHAQDPKSVTLSDEWRDAQVIAAYDFRAYRMTEMGTDVQVTSFPAPIEVVLTTPETDTNLDVLIQADGIWTSAPEADISAEALARKSLGRREWRAASVDRLGRLCLIKY